MKAKAFLIVLRDALLLGALLVAFALFHHVLPKSYDPIRSVAPAFSCRDKCPNAAAETGADDPAGIAATPAPAPGDFSAAFPDYDTGENADYSYQTDDLRIAVRFVQENGIACFVADVWVRNIELFRTAFAGGAFSTGVTETVRRMARDAGAVLAVSGDFCGARKSGVVIRNGVLYRENGGEGDVCVLYYDGVMEACAADAFSLEQATARGAWQAWSFGPKLLEDGRAVAKFSGNRISGQNPRCAIGYYAPGHYCLVVVDGRQDGYSEGMTLGELAAFFVSLGCEEAYNLDGGATAAMAYDGEVISRPAGGGRKSSDIICFLREDG